MRKEVGVVFILSLILFALPAYGAGSSTGGTGSSGDASGFATSVEMTNDSDNESVVNPVSPRIARRQANAARRAVIREQYQNRSCEDIEIRRERIKCRLVQGDEYQPAGGVVPEACRLNAENRGHCVALYNTVKRCYVLEGTDKDRCFKRVIGLRKARLSDEEPEERPQKARDYVIALLYDLQERIEDKAEEGDVSPDDSVQMIDKIVEIKQDILNGEGREIIRAKMRELRTMWQGTMRGVENE